ncbi:MAG: hypothetical protein H7249_15940 [Chitinophagaceae bacterium]|nr:hypothetical protein [Oligoflexus sp.]
MKTLFLTLSLTAIAGLSAKAQAAGPLEITAPVDSIFIPNGFDDNDNVEIVVKGNFPDTCYQVGKISAAIDAKTRIVTVSASSLRYPGVLCIKTITPFIQSVKLGALATGDYQAVYADNKNVSSSFKVESRKTESADDYLYATVENASIDVNTENGKQSLRLQGHFPYFFVGCMAIKEVRITRSPSDVLVVLPIAEIVNTEICEKQPADHSFEYTSELPESFVGEGLLHVRTLDGMSLNRFLNIKH